jgi:acetyltransferase-like isoleucine patch superfamily enzyme
MDFSKLIYFSPTGLLRNAKLNMRHNNKFNRKKVILISPETKLDINKTAKILMDENSKLNMGFLGHIFSHDNETRLIMKENSKLIVKKGNCTIKKGCILFVGENQMLELGENLTIVSNTKILAYSDIKIGKNCIIGWESQIMSGDGHEIFSQGKHINFPKPILIEDDVWIGTRVTILKGVTIGKGSIVATNSTVTKNVPSGVIVGGSPAKVISENIDWKI